MGAEKKLEKRCTDVSKANGWYTTKLSSPSHRGVPDRIFIREGNVVFVEFKAPGNHPTKLQAHTIDQMQDHGALVYVVDTIEKFKALLEIYT